MHSPRLQTFSTVRPFLIVFIVAFLLSGAGVKADLQLSNFSSSTGTFYTWQNNAQAVSGTVILSGGANDGGGIHRGFTTVQNWTQYADSTAVLTVRKDAGNQLPRLIFVIMTQTPNYHYHYSCYFPEGIQAGNPSFFKTSTAILRSPTLVLDVANNFAYVGSGTAFAPDLSKVIGWNIQGSIADPPFEDARLALDDLTIMTGATNIGFDGSAIVSPATTKAGDSIQITVPVRNFTAMAARPCTIKIGLAGGAANSTPLYMSVPSVPPSQTTNVAQTFTVPCDWTGTHQLSLELDFDRVTGDSDLSNNSTTTTAIEFAQPATLIASGSSWSWLHPLNGVDPGASISGFQANWMKASYPNFSNSGVGPLGYGTFDLQPISTNIGTPPSGSRYTAYFRKTFTLPARVTGNFFANMICDDGAVIYIDGQRVGDYNHPSADTYTSFAPLVADETKRQCVPLMVTSLNAGTHLLAVSVHNNAMGSSDLAFDLELGLASNLPTSDLSLSGPVIVNPNNPSPGAAVEISVPIKNVGVASALPCVLDVQLYIESAPLLINTVSIPALASGSSYLAKIPVRLPDSALGRCNLSLNLDPSDLNKESEKANNLSTQYSFVISSSSARSYSVRLIFDNDAPFKIAPVNLPRYTEPVLCFSTTVSNANTMKHTDTSEETGAGSVIQLKVEEYMRLYFRNSKVDNLSISVSQSGHPDSFNIYFVSKPDGLSIGGQAEAVYRHNSKGNGNACVVADRRNRSVEAYARWLAFAASHECGHLMGLPHVANGASSISEDEIMDYTFDFVNSGNQLFANQSYPLCKAYNSLDAQKDPGDCNTIDALRSINPQYHLRRYVDGESDASLRAEGVYPATYDMPAKKWYEIFSNDVQNSENMEYIKVCRVNSSGLEAALTMTEIGSFSTLASLSGIAADHESLLVFGAHPQGGRVWLSNHPLPTSTAELLLGPATTQLFWVRFDEADAVIGGGSIDGTSRATALGGEEHVLSIHDGEINHKLRLNVGQIYRLQESKDLVEWGDVRDFLDFPPLIEWSEVPSRGARLFYRIVRVE